MIGARFSLFPMCDEFVSVITKAVQGIDHLPLEREVDPVSTFLSGDEETLFLALREAFSKAGEGGRHVVMSLTLSRGCPGEPDGDICRPSAAGAAASSAETSDAAAPDGGAGTEYSPRPNPSATDSFDGSSTRCPEVTCQFSLYPMGTDAYMDIIYRQIATAKANAEPTATPQHFCTRLDGSLTDVLRQLRRSFDAAAALTPHIVIHATLSMGSPTDEDALATLSNPRERKEG